VKLEGSLDAFGLPDIFQLLSYTKKTGGLHLRNGAVDGVVYFASGSVTGASGDSGRQTLARRLVGSGAVGDGPLGEAVARARSDGVGVGRALLEAGAVDAEVLRQAAVEQAVDAVFELLGWSQGDFSFSVDEPNPDDLGVELATESVVAEAVARRETAAQSSALIESPAVVLAMPVVPPDQRELSPDEWALVALADGRRNVGEIADLTGSGYVTVVQALAALTERGLLEPVGGDTDHASAVRRRLAMLAPLENISSDSSTSTSSSSSSSSSSSTVTQPAPTQRESAQPAGPAQVDPAVEAPAAAMASSATAGSLAPRSGSFVPASPAPVATAKPVPAPVRAAPEQVSSGGPDGDSHVTTIGGPHVPENVVPPRPEPFQARRQPDHPETHPARPARTTFEPARPVAEPSRPPTVSAGVGGVNGSAAMAVDPETAAVIERDPSVNRSLLLRLIAGVRGL
jgi:hypothetical protein